MYYESQEEKKLIDGLADLALKSGGIQNLGVVSKMLADLKPFPTPEEPAVGEGNE